jgi:hypothetical protein
MYVRGEVHRRRRPSRYRPPFADLTGRQRDMVVCLTVSEIADIVERAIVGEEAPWIDLPEHER